MLNRPYFLGMLLACLMANAHAISPKEQHAMDTREAAARYAEDRAICNDEKNQGQRMKCLRTAKGENERMLAEAKSRLNEGNQRPAATCQDCGKVVAVSVGERKGESNALGMIAGGVAGGLLGNQVGSGSGKKLATVAGAVGGAYAGKKIQENANSTKIWNVEVQYDNGQRGTTSFDQDPGLQRGDRVKKAGQSLMRI